jgi:hypothetical protein
MKPNTKKSNSNCKDSDIVSNQMSVVTGKVQHTNYLDKNNSIPDAIKNEWYIFYDKTECLDFLKTVDQSVFKFFAGDFKKLYGGKYYIVTKYDHIYNISNTCYTSLYEYCEIANNVKLHFDVDCKEHQFNGMTPDDALDFYINQILSFIKIVILPKIGVNCDVPYIILKSKTLQTKASAHIIYPSVVFDNIYDIKSLLLDCGINNDLYKNGILDLNIYRVGSFRLYKSSKLGKDNELEYYKSSNYDFKDDYTLFLDALICNISIGSTIINYDNRVCNANTNIDKKVKINNKIKTISTKNVTTNANEIHKILCIDKYSITELSDLVKLIDSKRADDYMEWIKIGIILYKCNNTNECLNIWKTFSSQSLKYDEYFCDHKWNTFGNKYVTLTIGTLKYYARTDNKEEYNKLGTNVINLQFETYNINKQFIITLPKVYNSKKLRNLNVDLFEIFDNWYHAIQKVLCIYACYGTGKTQCVKTFFNIYKPKRILFISYRQTLSYNLFGTFSEFGIKNYLDKGNFNADRLICQVDSLHKLMSFNMFTGEYEIPSYDLVILDEIESTLNHFNSSTLKDKLLIFNILEAICSKSTKVCALDGDIGNRSYEFLKHVNQGDFTVIKNEYVPKKNHWKFTQNEIKFKERLMTDAKNGLKLFIICMSSTKALEYEGELKKLGIKVVLHYSHADDELKKHLIDVNNYWIQFDVVMISPSIESGISFDEEYFDKMYIILSPESTSQRGLLQMTNRVRHLKTTDYDVFLNGISWKEWAYFYDIDEVINLNQSVLNNVNLIKNENGNMVNRDQLFVNMCNYNKLEELNKSSYYFVPYLLKLLKDKEQTYEFDKSVFKKNSNMFSISKANLISAKDIDKKEYTSLLKLQAESSASSEEKYAIEKYMYKFNWNVTEIDEEFLKKAYRKTHILFNNKAIRGESVKCYTTQDEEYFDIDLIIKKEKLEIVNDLLKVLEFKDDKDIFNDNIHKKDKFEELREKSIKICKLFNDKNSLILFGLHRKILSSNKSYLGFVNSIFKEFGITIYSKKTKIRLNKKLVSRLLYSIIFII